MNRTTNFLDHPGSRWPDEKWLARYFLTPDGRRTAFGLDNDSWGVGVECVDGTVALPRDRQIDIDLTILGNPDLGVLLFYNRWSATDGKAYYSKGDPRKLRQWILTKHGDRMPVGLFIPFEHALKSVIEFMRTNGALPKCIEWVAAADLPEDIFPEPEVRLRD